MRERQRERGEVNRRERRGRGGGGGEEKGEKLQYVTYHVHSIPILIITYMGKGACSPWRSSLSIVNCWMAVDPLRARNPSNGMLDVPVTN